MEEETAVVVEEGVETAVEEESGDVQMDDPIPPTNGFTNGHSSEAQSPADTPAVSTSANTPADSPSLPADSPTLPITSSMAAVDSMTSHRSPHQEDNDDDDGPPPAKRARTFSDADKASIAHVSSSSFVRRSGRANVSYAPSF